MFTKMDKTHPLSLLNLVATGAEAVLGDPLGSAQGLDVLEAGQLGVVPLLVEEGAMVVLFDDGILFGVLDASDGIPIGGYLLVDNLLPRKKQRRVMKVC